MQQMLQSLLLALFPPRCGACDVPLAHRPLHRLCPTCHDALELNHGPRCQRCDAPQQGPLCRRCRHGAWPFTAVFAPWLYGGPLAHLLVRAKFRGRDDLAGALGHLLVAGLQQTGALPLLPKNAVLVPMPLSRQRRRARGYNQSTVIARVLSARWHMPLAQCLRRCRNTAPQSDLPLAGRSPNVAGAFVAAAAPRTGVEPAPALILVDDVLTSGETARHAALALQQVTTAPLYLLTVARAAAAPLGSAARSAGKAKESGPNSKPCESQLKRS